MSTATLTSLAILKVHIDQGNDYLDYLRPFVLQVIFDSKFDPVNSKELTQAVREQYGLDIPEPCVQRVLKRISKTGVIKRKYGIYRNERNLSDPGVGRKIAEAQRNIQTVIEDFREYSKRTAHPIPSDDDAVEAICAFLTEFDISCLKSYLRGTVIPPAERRDVSQIVLVSDYVLQLRQTDPQMFDSFAILLQSHMLANALTCPDLANAPGSYKDTTFYFDTPLLVPILGHEGQYKKDAAIELIRLLRSQGGNVAVFGHTLEELKHVLLQSANYINSPQGRGGIVMEARQQGVTRSDLILMAETAETRLQAEGFQITPTPHYDEEFQIDESFFDQVLQDAIDYYNPRAKQNDINSVRSIYALRGKHRPRNVERAKAVLVTSNGAFANAAFHFGEKHFSTQDVSSVMTDFSLANVAWLKAPMRSLGLPRRQLLAFSYGALQPSNALLDRYLEEIERLEKDGVITVSHHQILRSSFDAYSELMRLTLGNDDAFTVETANEIVERVTSEIKNEEHLKFVAEKDAHRRTIRSLETEKQLNQDMISNLQISSTTSARMLANVFSIIFAGLIGLVLLLGLSPFDLQFVPRAIIILVPVLLSLLTFVNLTLGSNVIGIRNRIEAKILKYLMRRQTRQLGINWDDFGISV